MTNGEIRRAIEGQKTNALLGILPSGGFKYYENSPYDEVKNDGVKNTFTFGPMLVYDGSAYTQKVGKPRRSDVNNPKYLTAIGQIDSNNYVIIAAKSTSTLNNAAKLGVKLDCKMLYNLDGGGSSTMWFRGDTSGKGKMIKSSSRPVGDALYFTSGK
jgi:exopolysaccharide biosynthesis protein